MAQLVIRNLDDQLKIRLGNLAKRHGRSLEEEAQEIFRYALREQDVPSTGLGTEIAALFRDNGLEEEIRELRGYSALPVSFEP